MKFKIGKGLVRQGAYRFAVGMQTANVEKETNPKLTLGNIAKRIAKTLKIKDGEVEIRGVEFTYRDSVEDEQ